jgi:isopenicillin-N epimerase
MNGGTQPPPDWESLWALDPTVIFLNHGSFGACPRAVLEAQQRLRDRMECDPVQFFQRDLEELLDDARRELASFLGADPHHLAFVPNTTTGVNTVLRSLSFKPGDELLTTNHAHNACRNALEFAARQSGAQVITATIPFPLELPEEVVEAVLNAVTTKTRLALLDHVTSQTGLVFPIERLVHELARRGVETLVDGAHAPGMLPLNVKALGAAYYVGNCHKWLCAPKGAAFLYVRPDRQAEIRPLALSHGANATRSDRSRFHLEFDWTGTDDPSAWLCVPVAIRFLASLLPGGWPEVMVRNHALALEGRDLLCGKLGIEPPCPDEMVGTMAALLLPQGGATALGLPLFPDPLQETLYVRFRIEVPITVWPVPRRRLLRLSAHLYNTRAQYASLAQVLAESLAGQGTPE